MFLCILKLTKGQTQRQWCKRNIFQRGKVTFPNFFQVWNMLFLSGNFPFWYTPNKRHWFQKVKSKKKKKSSLLIFTLLPFHFSFPTFHFSNFPSFLLHFPFFLCLYFPNRSAKKISVKNVRGAFSCPPPPRYTTGQTWKVGWPNMMVCWWAKHDRLVGQIWSAGYHLRTPALGYLLQHGSLGRKKYLICNEHIDTSKMCFNLEWSMSPLLLLSIKRMFSVQWNRNVTDHVRCTLTRCNYLWEAKRIPSWIR